MIYFFVSEYRHNIYGQRCVQSVVFYPRNDGQDQPLSAKVIFNSSIAPLTILEGQKEAYLLINSKFMCCKKYQPKKKQRKDRKVRGINI